MSPPPPPDSAELFEHWLDGNLSHFGSNGRLVKTAVAKVLHVAREYGQANDTPPDLVGRLSWIEGNRTLWFSILVNEGRSQPTAASYISRFRTAVERFRNPEAPPRRPREKSRGVEELPPPPKSPTEQLSEALIFLDRWPALRPYLREALVRASQDILTRSTTSPLPPPAEDPKKER